MKPEKMKFKMKLMRLIENHIYFKRMSEDTADRIIELFDKYYFLRARPFNLKKR